MKRDASLLMDLGSLPFHLGLQPTPSNGDAPNTLPFRVGICRETDRIVQMPDLRTSNHLREAYSRGSIIGTAMSESGFGRKYADDFLDFLVGHVDPRGSGGHRLLEVGCGTGYLLHRLHGVGFDVRGIEPGAQGQFGAQRYGVRIFRDTFPCEVTRIEEKFDVVVHYGVLEHTEDPVAFLRAQTDCLSQSGMIVFAVPDCSEYIAAGDLSMFVHEHWNYFSPRSLGKTVEQAGLKLLHLERARYGGALYAVAGASGQSMEVADGTDAGAGFKEWAETSIRRMAVFFQDAERAGRSVGIFCPGRAVNLLHILNPRASIRFFDDEISFHGRYYPPLSIPVESRDSLRTHPVDELLIMSSTFGLKLKETLEEDVRMEKTSIRLYREVLEDQDQSGVRSQADA